MLRPPQALMPGEARKRFRRRVRPGTVWFDKLTTLSEVEVLRQEVEARRNCLRQSRYGDGAAPIAESAPREDSRMAKVNTEVLGAARKLLDARLADVRHVQYAYAAPTAATRRKWEERACWLRQRVLTAAGLLPEPGRTPLRPRVFDRSDFDGYSVEKVHFESRPGFLVTGSLYRPLSRRGRRPAILCPHGHWQRGRVEHGEAGSVPARCAMLARLGFVVFSYDMVGYNDSCQVEHRWPPDVLRRTLLYGVGPFGLQLWNSIRAVDFISSLPDVDPTRIGCTGASGGATQTYYLAVVDDRVRVVVPVCMMSAHYQGGCACEEAPLLHLGDLTTVDVVAALAPRPVLLPSVTQDWTNQNPEYEVPAVRSIYALFGAEQRVGNVHFDAPHNYNRNTREHMYAWFLRWLTRRKNVGRRVREPDFPLPRPDQLRLFPTGNPPARFKRRKALLEHLIKQEQKAFARPPKTSVELRRLRAAWMEPYAEVLGAEEPREAVSVGTPFVVARTSRFVVYGRVIGRFGKGEQIPALWIVPKNAGRRASVALVVCGGGKKELFAGGRPKPLLAALTQAGIRVLAIDVLGTGETKPLLEAERLDRSDPLFYAFNPSLVAHRVQDILTSLAAIRQHDGVKRPALVGLGTGGVLVLLARPLAGPLGSTVVDLGGCKTGDDEFWMGDMYHPLIRKVGDVRGAVALGPLSPLMVASADAGLARWARAIYRIRRKTASLRVSSKLAKPKQISAWVCAGQRVRR